MASIARKHEERFKGVDKFYRKIVLKKGKGARGGGGEGGGGGIVV